MAAATLRGVWSAYERQLAAKPIPTQMATSGVLWCIGDWLAQRIEHYESCVYGPSSKSSSTSSSPQHSAQQQGGEASMQQQGAQPQQHQHQQEHQQELLSSSSSSSSSNFTLDRRRLLLTSVFGAGFIGPVGHFWYEGIEKVCRRLVPTGGVRFLSTKVVLDSAIMGSVYVIAFFAFIATALEGTGLEGFKQKMKVDFIPTYIAELAFWPLVQTLNFSQVPVRHQLLVVNTFSLLDAAFISWVGNQEGWATKMLSRLGLQDAEDSKQA